MKRCFILPQERKINLKAFLTYCEELQRFVCVHYSDVCKSRDHVNTEIMHFYAKKCQKCSIKILMRPRTQDVDLNSLHLLWMLYRFLLFEWRKKWVTWVRWITKVRQKCYFSKKFQSCKWQCYQSEWWFPSQANANSILTILAFARRDASKKTNHKILLAIKILEFH